MSQQVDVAYPEEQAERIHEAFYDEWKFCGCGTPEDALGLVRDVLATIQRRWDGDQLDRPWEPDGRQKYEAEAAELRELLPNDPLHYFVLYALTAWDLLEHGGSVGGSWLTDKGKALLADLETPRAIELATHTRFVPRKGRISPDPNDPKWRVDLDDDE